jgi:glycerophosphoryl diester phosphodiesterase
MLLMTNYPSIKVVASSYANSWHLRWPLFLMHLSLTLLAIAVLSPICAGLIHLALRLSGEPALADQDIAAFLLSPVGFFALVVVASVIIARGIFGVLVMMTFVLADHEQIPNRITSCLSMITSKITKIIEFAARFFVCIVLIIAPFVLLGIGLVWRYLSEFDINYYLTERPPEAMAASAAIVVILITLAIVLINRLLAWYLTLPLILFDDTSPASVFAVSANKMRGFKVKVLRRMVIWIIVVSVAWVILAVSVSTFSQFVLPMVGQNLIYLSGSIGVIFVIWAILNAFLKSIAAGSFVILLLKQSETIGLPVTTSLLKSSAGENQFKRILPKVVAGMALIVVIGVVSGGMALAKIQASDNVEIISHRGAAGRAPENTMAAIEAAIEDGADWIEIDVQESADGEVVVIHDSDFMKIAGVDLKVWDATMVDIENLDVGSWYAPVFADQRAPLLRDVLLAAKERSKVLIELKFYDHNDMLEQRVADIIEETGMSADIAIMSLKSDLVRSMQVIRPEWRAGLLAATAIGDLTHFDVDFLAVSSGMVNQQLINRAGEAGKDIYVWTINDPLSMSRMISMGVDGLITDEPALARQVLAQRARLSTSERILLWAANFFGLDISSKTYRDNSP